MATDSRNKGQGLLSPLRIIVEAASAFFLTAGLLNYGVFCTSAGEFFASLQIVPAALALALPVLAFWLAITLLFGRIYCSTVCPIGALSDLASRVRPARKVYRYSRSIGWLRALSLAVIVVLLCSRTAFALQWLEPFGIYASLVENFTSLRVCVATFVSASIVGVLFYTGYSRGRLFCNTLCPVGTLLGVVARRSAMHIDINTDRCVQCRRCVDVCKSECIDIESHTADMSRCVVCFNCLTVCPNKAISYTTDRHTLSDPLLQKIETLKPPKIVCDNTSTSCETFSTTERHKSI